MRLLTMRRTVLLALGATFAGSSLFAADDPKKNALRAPGDSQIMSSDRTGAYFVSRPLKESHDQLLRRLAELRSEINEARIQPDEARRRLDVLSTELATLRKQIDQAKVYIPGANIHIATTTETIPFPSNSLLLIDANHLEIRGWDQPMIRCVLEKTVLSEGVKDVSADLDAISVAQRKVKGDEVFGFYKDIQAKAEFKADWDRFPFKEFLRREFLQLRITGVAHDEGNSQITVEMKNEEGSGITAGKWRRHAKLIVFVPKCQRLGVRGALGGFKVDGLDANLIVHGDGDRDYDARYEIANLRGSVSTQGMPIHQINDVTGDISVDARPHMGNTSTTHDDRGVTMEPGEIGASRYQDVLGDLQIRSVRADLSIGGVTGRVDVENDFGRVSWLIDRPIGKVDHRVVSQGGAIEVRLGANVLGGLSLNLFTECGIIHMDPGMNKDFEDSSFSGFSPDGARRGWHGFTTKARTSPRFDVIDRLNQALQGGKREPGVDIISRGGTVLLSRPGL
jgi:hypothetical protein